MNEVPMDLEATKVQLRYIYNSYRTALLNRKYYGHRLTWYQNFNETMEIAIAIGAAGSGGVAGFAIWGTITGRYAWLLISATATILGVVKPIIRTGVRIENYTKLYTGHSSIYLELKSLVEDIEVSKAIPSKVVEQYVSIKKQIAELGGLDDPDPTRS